MRVLARLLSIAKNRSFTGGHEDYITADGYGQADTFLLRKAQQPSDFANKGFKCLKPERNSDGLWVLEATRLLKEIL